MKKIKCPKCRRILFRFEAAMDEGLVTINIDCPDCRSMTIVNIDPKLKHDTKEKLGSMPYDENEIMK